MDGRRHSVFKVGGKVYNLRISFNALAEYNKKLGGTLEDFNNAPLWAYRAVLCAGINAYGNQSVTVEQAGDLCEEFVRENGQKAFQDMMKDVMDTAQEWLGKTGDDTGKNPIRNPEKPSESLSKNAKISHTG